MAYEEFVLSDKVTSPSANKKAEKAWRIRGLWKAPPVWPLSHSNQQGGGAGFQSTVKVGRGSKNLKALIAMRAVIWRAIDKKGVPIVWVRIELTKAHEQRYVETGAWVGSPPCRDSTQAYRGGNTFWLTQTCQKFRKPIDMVYIRLFNN